MSVSTITLAVLLAGAGQAPIPDQSAPHIDARPVEVAVQAPTDAAVRPQTTVTRPVTIAVATREGDARADNVYLAQATTDEAATPSDGLPANPAAPASATPTEPAPEENEAATVSAEAQPETQKADDSGVIVVTGDTGPPPGDPLEGVNLVTYETVQAVDKAIVAPVAKGYKSGLPKPVRDGVHNALNNLDEPVVFLNFLLQFKIGKAFETLGRFAINSTLGLAGLIDIAKREPFYLPRRKNGFGYTLGYYGVDTGPYFYLPLIGPTTLRDVFGRITDLSVLPVAAGKPFSDPVYALGKGTLSSLDDRVEMDDVIIRIQDSVDPYATMREYYLTKRAAEIDVLKGKRDNADISLDDLENYIPLNEKVKTTSGPQTQEPDTDETAPQQPPESENTAPPEASNTTAPQAVPAE
ncbi:MAG: VacJ family lipoprotein [Novosphingobium sp.]|nr:VacJ family lipoprotein [Novosphingobium sp.]